MVCVGQLHSQHPSLHCLGVINTAELILKSPVVRIFPVLSDPREECYDIYNYISTPLFILAIQTTGGRDGGNIARYHFYFYSVAGLGAGDPV